MQCGARAQSSQAAEDPLLKRVIGGSYILQEVIGVGGMGRVYRAEQNTLGRTVAVKVIHPHLLGDDQTVARFYTEARATSRLNHPNSVSVIDFGRTDDGILYLVMEFLNGRDLGFVIEQEGPLSFLHALEIASGVLAALDEAHALGVVHRDLKPENIIIKRLRNGSELIKVVDFGLATIAGPFSTSITRPGLVCGTPDYMSPEQGRGEIVDGRGDLYAVGVVLFELLTDRLPYIDDSPTKLVMRHINDPIPDPREIAPGRGIPGFLAEFVMRAMAKSADDRFQTALSMREAVGKLIERFKPESKTIERIVCEACGCVSESGSRFCRECGAALTSAVHDTSAYSSPPRPSSYPRTPSVGPLIGREHELTRFDRICRDTAYAPKFLYVVGPKGSGKSRLIEEMARRSRAREETVLIASAHPSGAPVPYHAIRVLFNDLQTKRPFESWSTTQKFPLLLAAHQELFQPQGLPGVEFGARAEAVAELLAAAVLEGIRRSGHRRLVLFIDDVDACCGLTRRVLDHLPHTLGEVPCVIIQASESLAHLPSMAETTVLNLKPLRIEEVTAAYPHLAPLPGEEGLMIEEGYSPLYVEQMLALDLPLPLAGHRPLSLADAVMQRTERLDLSSRKLLQAIAVLGYSCAPETLSEFVNDRELSALAELKRRQLVIESESGIRICHPWVRDLVESSIPAEHRRELHDRAMRLEAASGYVEVRAEHAWRGTDLTTALVLLEKMGSLAVERGDARPAVLAFRRGLELARRELLNRGDESLDSAVVTFSLNLGRAMNLAGDAFGADGVLMEAVDLTGPDSLERGKMWIALGHVQLSRDRRQQDKRWFEQALALAVARHDAILESEAKVGVAAVAFADGEIALSVQAHREALAALSRMPSEERRFAQVTLALAEVLTDSGQVDEAYMVFERASELALRTGIYAMAAMAEGGLGTVQELRGIREQAIEHYRTAVTYASLAGDAVGLRRWQRATDTLADKSRS